MSTYRPTCLIETVITIITIIQQTIWKRAHTSFSHAYYVDKSLNTNGVLESDGKSALLVAQQSI